MFNHEFKDWVINKIQNEEAKEGSFTRKNDLAAPNKFLLETVNALLLLKDDPSHAYVFSKPVQRNEPKVFGVLCTDSED